MLVEYSSTICMHRLLLCSLCFSLFIRLLILLYFWNIARYMASDVEKYFVHWNILDCRQYKFRSWSCSQKMVIRLHHDILMLMLNVLCTNYILWNLISATDAIRFTQKKKEEKKQKNLYEMILCFFLFIFVFIFDFILLLLLL